MAIERIDGLSTLCCSCCFFCQQRVLKTFPGPAYFHSKDGVVWIWHFLVDFYIKGSRFYLATTQSQSLMWLVIGRDGDLNILCDNCEFYYQQRVLKMFPGPGYLFSKDGVAWMWHFFVNMHMYGSPYYLVTPQSQCFVAIERDCGLSPLCHNSRFACQQRVLKTFPGPGYVCSKEGVVWLWHFFVNLHIHGSSFYLAATQSHCLMTNERDDGLSTLCYSCRFGCKQRVLKLFTGLCYLHSEDGEVWIWYFFINLHIYDSPFYLVTSQSSQCLMAFGRDGGLSTLFHSWEFACQQRVLKT